MIEVETKRSLGEQDVKLLKDNLLDAGYKSVKSEQEVDIYYTRPDINFMETVECLRIRSRNSFAEMTYKPPTKNKKDRGAITAKRETNVELANIEQVVSARFLLENIGMIELAVVDKKRQTYIDKEHPCLTIALDTINGLGSFVEVEVISEDEHKAAELVARTEKKLNIHELPIVLKPYRDLVMELHENI